MEEKERRVTQYRENRILILAVFRFERRAERERKEKRNKAFVILNDALSKDRTLVVQRGRYSTGF